jgi:hypothetical protein
LTLALILFCTFYKTFLAWNTFLSKLQAMN